MFAARYSKYKVEAWLVLGGIAVCLVYATLQQIVMSDPGRTNFVRGLGVPLDDVYIHLRYAQNLQHGFGYSFNLGEVLTADTSPLWVVLIALVGSIASRLEFVSIGLSIISYLIIAPGIFRTARDLFHVSESNARLAGWAAVLTSRLAWSAMSGMETALAVLLMLLSVESHIRAYQRRRVSSKEALWLGLGVLVRPEFVLVAFILMLHWIYLFIREQVDARRALIAILFFFALASPAVLLPLTTNGSVLSHSSTVQASAANTTVLEYLFFAIKTLAEPNIIIALLAFAALVTLYWRSDIRLLSIIVVAFILTQAFFAPQTRHHGRYLFLLFPLLILIATVAWQEHAHKLSPKIARVVPALMILFAILSASRWSYLAASDVRNINDQHLAAAQWLMQNHRTNDVVAAGDVGAIGYLSGQRILDPNGLITPAAWNVHANPDSLWHLLRSQGANIFVIYPRWDRAFFTRYQDSLVLRGSLRARLPLTSSADTTLNIYRLRNGS
jgi:hypothetical protein